MRILDILQAINSISVQNPSISKGWICGGIPRDKIIGHAKDKFEDLDITNGDESIRRMADRFASLMEEQYNITKKVANDGHVSVKLGSFKVDFSSNFIVPNCDQLLKSKGITKPTAMQREIFSRDFTCNALLLSLDLKTIEDPTGVGMRDIKNKIIKTCLDPEITLKYNVNRIPRIVYMAAKLGFSVDPEIIKWVRLHPEVVSEVKPRYMLEKIEKAMSLDQARSLDLIGQMSLWSSIPQSNLMDQFRK